MLGYLGPGLRRGDGTVLEWNPKQATQRHREFRGTSMERVTVTYARTHLSELAARAEGGETIEITRRGTVVARLMPIEPKSYPISHPLPPSRISWLRQQSRHVAAVSNRRLGDAKG